MWMFQGSRAQSQWVAVNRPYVLLVCRKFWFYERSWRSWCGHPHVAARPPTQLPDPWDCQACPHMHQCYGHTFACYTKCYSCTLCEALEEEMERADEAEQRDIYEWSEVRDCVTDLIDDVDGLVSGFFYWPHWHSTPQGQRDERRWFNQYDKTTEIAAQVLADTPAVPTVAQPVIRSHVFGDWARLAVANAMFSPFQVAVKRLCLAYALKNNAMSIGKYCSFDLQETIGKCLVRCDTRNLMWRAWKLVFDHYRQARRRHTVRCVRWPCSCCMRCGG
jgi:hypothetical protein